MTELEIEKLNSFFTSNIDLIPVSNYGFSQDVLERVKKIKHTNTNNELTLEERKHLNKNSKQKIARGLGVTHHLVSDILSTMDGNSLNHLLPKKPKTIKALNEKNDDNEPMEITSNLKFIAQTKKNKKKLPKSARRNKFKGRDYETLLTKAEKRNEKINLIREKNPEKAKNIEKNIQWERAIQRASGEKDNIELLKKGLKAKQKQKKISKQKWTERKKALIEKQKKKQEKRNENIRKRKADKIDHKKKKRLKKGT